MPNLSSILKAEISRLARKEVRSEAEALKRASAAQRADIASLKKQIRDLQGQLKRMSKTTKVPQSSSSDDGAEVAVRFRAAGMKTHREKLGISAKDYGLLVGASALSIYKWEDGKVKPRAGALHALARVRAMGKREALEQLDRLRSEAG